MPSGRLLIWTVLFALVAVTELATAAGASEAAPQKQSEDELRARLEALGYVAEATSDPQPKRTGVVLHDEDRAAPGINVYCSVHTADIKFMDMAGKLLHTIRMPDAGTGADCMLEPDGNGSFVALANPRIMRIGWDSEVEWTSERGHHHDFAISDNGEVHSFSERPGTIVRRGHSLAILDHVISVLGRDGALLREVPLTPLFEKSIQRRQLARMLAQRNDQKRTSYVWASDVYHPNSIDILQRDSPLGRRGDWLVCLRSQNLVAVIDPKGGGIRWSFGRKQLDRPHDPSVLANGNLLIFDNGRHRGWSRILEVDPSSRKPVWQYAASPPGDFFSKVRGSAQELSNGNVLITESTKGRAFEVTRSGEIVWDFWNPDRTAEGKRHQIYRMIRLDPKQLPRLQQDREE